MFILSIHLGLELGLYWGEDKSQSDRRFISPTDFLCFCLFSSPIFVCPVWFLMGGMCYVFGLLSLCTMVYWFFDCIPFFINFLWSSYIITMFLHNVHQWLNLTQGSFTTIIYWSYYTYVHMVHLYTRFKKHKKQFNSNYWGLYTVWICRDHIWLDDKVMRLFVHIRVKVGLMCRYVLSSSKHSV